MKTGTTPGSFSMGGGIIDYETMRSYGYSCADYQGLINTAEGKLYHVDDDEFVKLLTDERKRANDAGITFSQVHAPWPTNDFSEEARAQKLLYMKKALYGASLLGGGYLVVHPVMPFGWGKNDDQKFTEQCNLELFSALCAYGMELGVGVCVENMPFPAYPLSRITALADFVRASGIPNFHICLDTGHCNVLGDDCGEMVRVCGDLLRTLHVHDNNGKQDLHALPFSGSIDWESFRCALRDINYQGCVSLETGISRKYPQPIRDHMQKGLAMTADYLAFNM